MKLKTLHQRAQDGKPVKIYAISHLTGSPDIFAGMASNVRFDADGSLLLDLDPYVFFRSDIGRLDAQGIPGHSDRYHGLRLYKKDHVTTGFTTHTREVSRIAEPRNIKTGYDMYLEAAKAVA